MNVLVIGSNGQLALEFKNSLNSKNLNFIFFGRKKINLFSLEDIFFKVNKHKISIIINCSAFTNVDEAEKKKKTAYNLNCVALKNIVKICKLKKLYLIHFSTDYVFNGYKKNYSEKNKTNPINYYGKTKKIGEEIIKKNLQNYVIFRLSWLIGNFSNNFLKSIFLNIKNKKKILMVNDQISNPTMTILVSKIVKICCEKYFYKKKFLKGIYHLSNEPPISKLNFTKFIYLKLKRLKLIKNYCEITEISSINIKNSAKRPRNSSFNLSKIKSKLKIRNLSWKNNIKKILIKL